MNFPPDLKIYFVFGKITEQFVGGQNTDTIFCLFCKYFRFVFMYN